MAKSKKETTKSTPKKSTPKAARYEVQLEGEHAGDLKKIAAAAGVTWREACRQALHHFCEEVAAGKASLEVPKKSEK